MSFTEVNFELSDPRHPLCRAASAGSGAHAIYRVLDHGIVSQRHRAHVDFHGRPDAALELARELRAGRTEAIVEVLDQTPERTGLRVDAPIAEPSGLAALWPVLDAHTFHAPLVDPIVAMDGRVRVRLVIPRHAEPQQVLRALQDVQRAAGFADFRITRIAPLAPQVLVEMARRPLTSEQEALLALANSLGYYETPKSVTLEQIARTVGLSISPVHKRLKAAEEAIVSQHVAHDAPDAARRRARVPTHLSQGMPWELQIRARGDFGPANFLAQVPAARASLHVLSSDGARAQSSLLVVVAPDDAQAKLLSGLEERPEIASMTLVERSPRHVVCRLTTREHGAYALSWWNEAWGYDASLRSVVFEQGEALMRALLTRPFTSEALDTRLRDCARGAGWTSWEVASMRSLVHDGPPPTWPDPLTQRQLEVLRVAHALGYYRTPRECTLEHVAKTLGVSANAVHKNLVLAESKLISAYLAAGL